MLNTLNETGHNQKFTIPGGATFDIKADNSGLFVIVMNNGGVLPDICKEKFTSYKAARRAIQAHVEKKTKVEYPEGRAKKD